mmetsp:Transcript_48525/g.109336  ORF Transcript_48525/g.109336 Transcript_48525/m.109336 type:complete len:210 (+) Transcript_48525:278-907(+)
MFWLGVSCSFRRRKASPQDPSPARSWCAVRWAAKPPLLREPQSCSRACMLDPARRSSHACISANSPAGVATLCEISSRLSSGSATVGSRCCRTSASTSSALSGSRLCSSRSSFSLGVDCRAYASASPALPSSRLLPSAHRLSSGAAPSASASASAFPPSAPMRLPRRRSWTSGGPELSWLDARRARVAASRTQPPSETPAWLMLKDSLR